MDLTPAQRMQAYLHARLQHPAWQLLASRRSPLVLSCLQSLFEQSQVSDGIAYDDALQSLADMLRLHANDSEMGGAEGEDPATMARRELRGWIKRALVIERDGRLYATDALETALRFVESLSGRIMTSTASRLSVVQREIERLESNLNPDAHARAERLRRNITELERELAAVEDGEMVVLDAAEAAEGIREVYGLAIGLRADFRRVEDSWRDADRALRHSIVSEHNHRGAVVDTLLDGHEDVLQTAEGRVFQGFQQQLKQDLELDQMKARLRAILRHPGAQLALDRQQQNELRWLVMRLVKESSAVIRARSRSERDVRSFLKTGLAAEQHRVGMLLNTLFQQAQAVDWQAAATRRAPSPLPPIGIACGGLPAVERLRFKSLDSDARRELELHQRAADLDEIGAEFWAAFDGLDRDGLLRDTLALVRQGTQPLSIGGLAQALPPTHDLETIAVWLGMTREAGVPIGAERELVTISDRDGEPWCFDVPALTLRAADFSDFSWEP